MNLAELDLKMKLPSTFKVWVEGVDYGYVQTERLCHSTDQSVAFICTECGWRVWGYREYPNRPQWDRFYIGCEKHADDYGVPGSVMDDLWYEHDLKDFPPALLAREAKLHLQYYAEKGPSLDATITGAATGTHGG